MSVATIKKWLSPSFWGSASARQRWQVFSRVVAGFGLGYGVTAWFTAVLAWLLGAWGGQPAQAVLTATLWSFAVYTAIVIWAFSVQRLRTVWLGLLGCGATLGLLLWWLKGTL